MFTLTFAFLCLFLHIEGAMAIGSQCMEDADSSNHSYRHEEYRIAALALSKEFQNFFQLSENELNATIECIQKQDANSECQDKLHYYFERLPLELAQYRRNLALSRWNPANNLGTNPDETPAFNVNLKSPGIFWFSSVVKHEQLSDEELIEIGEEFQRKWRSASRNTLAEMDQLVAKTKNTEWFNREYEILKSGDFKTAYFFQARKNITAIGKWIGLTFQKIENVTFKLNKKRLIKQLSEHPILAHFKDREVNTQNILNALYRMKELSQQNQAHTTTDLNSLLSKAVVGNPTRNASLKASHFFPFLEHFSIIESTLSNNPELCGVFNHIAKYYDIKQYSNTALMLGAGIGLFVFASPVIAAGGFVALHAATVSESYQKLKFLSDRAFESPQPQLNEFDSADVFRQESEYGTNVMVSPLVLVGAPFMRFKNILKFINAT